MQKLKTHTGLGLKIALAIALGLLVGLLFGKKCEPLGEGALLIVKILKTLATPLIFLAVLDVFCKTELPARKGAKLLGLSFLNATVAACISFTLATFFPAGKYLNLEVVKLQLQGTEAQIPKPLPLEFWKTLDGFVPKNILQPFIENNVIPIVILAILLGLAFRKIKRDPHHLRETEVIASGVSGLFRMTSVLLAGIVQLVPMALFGIVAKVVGTSGFSLLPALSFFVLLITGGLAIQVFVYYSFLLAVYGRKDPRVFFRKASSPLLTAFATGSSLATLPVTLATLQDEMKVSESSARLAACVGTNLNHDGILLYEASAALFLGQKIGRAHV